MIDLTHRGVFWVARAKDNMDYSVKHRNIKKRCGNILRDDLIVLAGKKTKKHYGEAFRLVHAIVEIDGKLHEMTFIANNTSWAPSSVADLYKSRWPIETFFKEIKQTLQLSNFRVLCQLLSFSVKALGYSKNAVLWQVWNALLVYILLRYQAMASGWSGGFKRFYCLLRSNLWSKYNLVSLAKTCGTAHGTKVQRKIDAAVKFRHTQFLTPKPNPLFSRSLRERYAHFCKAMG